jgi:hypothetical protein
VPVTKHGGIGLYQCKDGFMLKGQVSLREIFDMNKLPT